jgi:hypothetical protein
MSMELDVTHMVDSADDMPMLSGSIAELGSNAGQITWNNSMEYGREHPLLTTDDARDEARKHFREYGAWTQEQIAAWSEDELQGIMCQDVAAAIREMEAYDTHEAFEKACESGRASGRLYRGDDGRWYFSLGC